MTNEELFYKEFTAMAAALRAKYGPTNLYDIPLPDMQFHREYHEIVLIQGINDEYYGKLNNTEALMWNNGQLKRKKFDYKGEYVKDEHDNQVYEDVTLPQNCIAVVSDKQIGVPLKHKTAEPFEYVDMVMREDTNRPYYVYIIPKKYCYKINQTALILNTNKMRVYYQGIGIILKNGSPLYLYVIPYKPTQKEKGYRVLCSKSSMDYSKEFTALRDFWLKCNFMFDPSICVMNEGTKGRANMAYIEFPTVLDEYIRYDSTKTLDNDYLDDLSYGEEDIIEEEPETNVRAERRARRHRDSE